MTAAPYNYSYIFKYIIIGESGSLVSVPHQTRGIRLMSIDQMFWVLKMTIYSSYGRHW